MNPGGRCTLSDADFEATPAPDGLRYAEPGEVEWLMLVADLSVSRTKRSSNRRRTINVIKAFLALMASHCFFVEGA